jgi:hypothetical protein
LALRSTATDRRAVRLVATRYVPVAAIVEASRCDGRLRSFFFSCARGPAPAGGVL